MSPRSVTLSLLLLGGCAPYHLAERPTPPLDIHGAPPEGLGRVCVLRAQRDPLAATAVVRDNARLVGATGGRSCFCYLARPGEHHITTEAVQEQGEAWASVRPGGRYYLQQDVEMTSSGMGVQLRWLQEEHGQEALRGCSYRTLSQVPRREALPGEVPVV